MLDALNITAEQAAGLDELAALDLAVARHFAGRAQAEADAKVATGLARIYQRAARSYRQTLALKAKLQRDLACAAREAAEAERQPEDVVARVFHRKTQLRNGIRRLVWDEHEDEPDDAFGPIEHELEVRLDAWSRTPGFLHQPIDELVDQILAELDPIIEATFRHLYVEAPDPPDLPDSPAAEPFEPSG